MTNPVQSTRVMLDQPFQSGPEPAAVMGYGLFLHLCLVWLPWLVFAVGQSAPVALVAPFLFETAFGLVSLHLARTSAASEYHLLKWLAIGELPWCLFAIGMIANAGLDMSRVWLAALFLAGALGVAWLNITLARGHDIDRLSATLRTNTRLCFKSGHWYMTGDAHFAPGACPQDRLRGMLNRLAMVSMVVGCASMLAPLTPLREIGGLPLAIFGVGLGFGGQIAMSSLLRDVVVSWRLTHHLQYATRLKKT